MNQIRCPACTNPDCSYLRPYRAVRDRAAAVFAELSVWLCNECTHAFAFPSPTETALSQYYAGEYRTDSDSPNPNGWSAQVIRARSQVDFIKSALPQDRFKSLSSWLDIGAGYGFLLSEARHAGAQQTAALEWDQHCHPLLRQHGHILTDNLREYQQNYDIISFSHLLEHIAQPDEFLANVHQALRPMSCVFCEVPNEIHLDRTPDDAPHLMFFTAQSLKRLFERCGFKVLALDTCGHPVGYMAQFTRRIGRYLFQSPPADLAAYIYPHYRYSPDGSWIRLAAVSEMKSTDPIR